MNTRILRLILGDQLNINHHWFSESRDDVVYLLMEVRQETDYVVHHIQKLIGFFAAMRNFAQLLRDKGLTVVYLSLDDEENCQSIVENVLHQAKRLNASRFEYLLPDEYRLDQQLRELCDNAPFACECFDTEHFFTKRDFLTRTFGEKQSYLMESFYRELRRKTGYLMDGVKPEGGAWNFDQKNRKRIGKEVKVPQPVLFSHDVSDLHRMIQAAGVKSIGSVEVENFIWPISREESLQLLRFFCEELLPFFGDYQDAMQLQQWSLFHSRLSFALNTKMISPKEVCEAAITQYRSDNRIALNQIEGFVRQILGWREYMRGVYWAKMPDYAQTNYFQHKRQLPSWYWTGRTAMKCLSEAIGSSLRYGYAHHIQRLMITGNFALLAGVDPDEVDQWYLGIYIDALQWVEITNTRGMSQFADGGVVGSKPYVSSANYINKMSDYCASCKYDYKLRSGEGACPFNSLYWNFFHQHREKLEKNPRIAMSFLSWSKMSQAQQESILNQATQYLENLEQL